ncbi:hypothetical protein [Psychrobacter frigidicola]|uniref:hypothetical protein n=1 Tax=Psychrobacter frigidicola TaxID=45611 RepID=UPI00191A7C6F|nr:hypothetical protein [Psychrobacter frigidicola]
MSSTNQKLLQNYRHLTEDGDITVHLTKDKQALILKTYDYGLNALSDIDEMLLSAVIRQLKTAINNPEDEPNGKH